MTDAAQRWAAAAVAVFALAACGGSSGSPAPDGDVAATTTVATAADTTTTVLRPERYEITTREETFVDPSRPTDPNGDFGGAPERTIRVVFHVPDGPGPFPVILFSHGWIATPEIYTPLLTELATHGYLVVAPAYPLSNGAAPGGPVIRDLVNQPADASFVLDEVLAASRNETQSWLYGIADPERIGTGGHSLGAMTSLGFYNSCCHDDRIDAVVALAGAVRLFTGTWFEGVDTPLLLVHGVQDELVPYAASEDAFAQASPPKYLLTFPEGRHADHQFGGETPGQRVVTEALLAFFDAYVRDVPGALDRLDAAGDTEGLSTLQSAR